MKFCFRLEKERINSLNQILDTYLEQLNQQTELGTFSYQIIREDRS